MHAGDETHASAELDRHENRRDGARIVAALRGLSDLRELLYLRIHRDMDLAIGTDSMLAPVEFAKTELATKTEIDVYLTVESAAEVRSGHITGGDDDWYLHWLMSLRLGERAADPEITRRIFQYWSRADDTRRQTFTRVLERTFPPASRAPLLLYRLLPPAAWLLSSLAFGDEQRAAEARNRQTQLQPAIQECGSCRGGVLPIGQECEVCGNPLWKYKWLTAV